MYDYRHTKSTLVLRTCHIILYLVNARMPARCESISPRSAPGIFSMPSGSSFPAYPDNDRFDSFSNFGSGIEAIFSKEKNYDIKLLCLIIYFDFSCSI